MAQDIIDAADDGICFRVEEDPMPRPALWRAAERTENMVGFVFQCLFTFTIGFSVIAMAFEQTILLRPMAIPAILAAYLWLRFDLPYLWHTWRVNYDGGRPLFVASALRQRIVPFGYRPIVAVWWLAHFAFVCAPLILNATATAGTSAPKLLGFFVLALLLSFAANGYLVQFVATFTRSGKILLRVWSFRFLLDVIAAAIAVLITRFPGASIG